MIGIFNKRGAAAINTITVTMALLIIFLGVFEYTRLITIVNGVKNTAGSSIESAATSFADDAYYELREGDNTISASLLNKLELNQRFTDDITTSLDLNKSIFSSYIKYSNGKVEFSIKNIHTTLSGGLPVFTGAFTLSVPVRFLGKVVYTANVPIMVQAEYKGKY